MNKINLSLILRGYLIFGSIYMLVESFLHFSNLRLLDSLGIWPESALAYSGLMTKLYASCALFFAILLFFIQKDMKKYELIIKILAVFSLFHALVLIYLSISFDFDTVFSNARSLKFWLSPYNIYLLIEAFLLLFYALVTYLWIREKK